MGSPRVRISTPAAIGDYRSRALRIARIEILPRSGPGLLLLAIGACFVIGTVALGISEGRNIVSWVAVLAIGGLLSVAFTLSAIVALSARPVIELQREWVVWGGHGVRGRARRDAIARVSASLEGARATLRLLERNHASHVVLDLPGEDAEEVRQAAALLEQLLELRRA